MSPPDLLTIISEYRVGPGSCDGSPPAPPRGRIIVTGERREKRREEKREKRREEKRESIVFALERRKRKVKFFFVSFSFLFLPRLFHENPASAPRATNKHHVFLIS